MAKETSKVTKRAAPKADEDKKKRRTKKDPAAPKRGLSAYMFFSQDQRSTVKEESPEATFGMIRFKNYVPILNINPLYRSNR